VNPEIIHFLREGRTPCLMRGVPRDWPSGHRWSDDWAQVTCAVCRAAYEAVEGAPITGDEGAGATTTVGQALAAATTRAAPVPGELNMTSKAEGRGVATQVLASPLTPVRDMPGWQEGDSSASPPNAHLHGCRSAGCTAPAAWVVHWPGQTTEMCDDCAVRARGVAEAMGFELATTPITGAAKPGALSPADAEAVTYTLGLVLGALASMADAAPAYLVYLTDLEAGRVASRPGLLGLPASAVREIVESLLPMTKVAIRLFKNQVVDRSSPDDGGAGSVH
jgi:hypothetical protein